MGLIDPAIAIIISLAFLVVLLYKRANLGIVLNAAALSLALLALDLPKIPTIIYETTTDLLTMSAVLATFGIMLLSQLYKETGVITKLSDSIGKLIKNPKIVLSLLPAIIGLLPVAGGALMSAPLVDREAEKLKMKPDKKAYVNLWFRHTIFPVYPLSPPIIITAASTAVAIPLIIMRQIPVVLVMVIVGFVIGLRKISSPKNGSDKPNEPHSYAKDFVTAFSPILTTIVVTLILDLFDPGVENAATKQSLHVMIAVVVGLAVMVVISRLSFKVFTKPFNSWGIYGVTFAAYGAFLLKRIMVDPQINRVFSVFSSNGGANNVLLLAIIPALLGLLTGSPSGGVAVSVPILCGSAAVAPNVAGLIYISAYLGYTIAPTHLCFTFTADYFKCPLGKMYKYVIPSFLLTFPIALLVYFLL